MTPYDEVNIKCPFYKSQRDDFIKCEGVYKNTIVKLKGESEKIKEIKEKLCSGKFETCLLYCAIIKKYE